MKKLFIALSLTVTLMTPALARSDNGRPAGCPHAWCGCWLAEQVFGRNMRELWKATAWLKFPRTSPRPGAIAVMRHHVGKVTGFDAKGNPIILSGNHGRVGVGEGVYPKGRIIAYVQP